MIDSQGSGAEACEAPTELDLPRMRAIFDDGELRHGGAEGSFVAGSDLSAGCATAGGPEAVYVFELAEASQLELGATNSEVLSVREAGVTDYGSEEIACETGLPDTGIEIALDLEPGRYAVILAREDPTQAASDDYSLLVMVNPAQ